MAKEKKSNKQRFIQEPGSIRKIVNGKPVPINPQQKEKTDAGN